MSSSPSQCWLVLQCLSVSLYLCGNNNIEIVPRNQDVLCQRWEEEGWGQRWRPWQGHWGKPGEKNRPHHLGLLVININQHYQSVFGLWTSLTPHKIPLLRRTDKMLKSSPWHIQNLKTPVHFSLNMKSTFLGHLTFQSETLARLPGTWLRTQWGDPPNTADPPPKSHDLLAKKCTPFNVIYLIQIYFDVII